MSSEIIVALISLLGTLAGGIPSSAYITSEGVLAVKHMDGTITAKISGNTLDLTISDGNIGSVEVISLM